MEKPPRPESAPVKKKQPSRSKTSQASRRPKTQLERTLSAVNVAAEMSAWSEKPQTAAPRSRRPSRSASSEPARAPPPRPDGPFPVEVLIRRNSEEPLAHVDLSRWTAFVDEETARLIASQNPVFRALTITCSAQLVDVQCGMMAQAFGHRLRQLDLSGCTSITDNAIKHFALAQQGAPALRDVSLSNCANLTDKSLRSLASLCATGKLERVAVAECANMTDHGVIGLAQLCRAITSIDVSGCVLLSDRAVASFGDLLGGVLVDVGVSRLPKLTDAGLGKVFSRSRRLRRVCARECAGVTDAGVRSVAEVEVAWGFKKHGGCARMEHLELTGSAHLTEFTLSWIVNACSAELKTLVLDDCDAAVTVKALGELGELAGHTLERLSLAGCASVTSQALEHFCREGDRGKGKLRRLRELDLSRCADVTDEAVRWIAKSCPELTHLYLEGQPQITDDAMHHVSRYVPGVVAIAARGMPRLTDKGLTTLSKRARRLTSLDVSRCPLLTYKCMRDIGGLRKMKKLNISGCALMSDRAVSTAPLTLHELDASMLPYLGDEGALAISRRNTVLRTLNLSHASGSLTDAAVRELLANCRELECLELTGCESIGQLALQTLARELSLTSMSAPSSEDPATFVGLRATEETRDRKQQRAFVRDLGDVQRSAGLVQRAYRRAMQRRVDMAAEGERQRHEEHCTITIQALVRGFVVRQHFLSVRRAQRTLAAVIRLRVWTSLKRKADARARRHYRGVLLRKAYVEWRVLTAENQRQLDQQFEGANLEVAQVHYDRKLREKAWAAWTMASESVLEEQIKTETALEFWASRAKRPLFEYWKSRRGTTARFRERNSVIFINCVHLHTLNSERHRLNVRQATIYHRRNLLAWVWTGVRLFCAEVSVVRAKMIVAAQFFDDKFFSTMAREVRALSRARCPRSD